MLEQKQTHLESAAQNSEKQVLGLFSKYEAGHCNLFFLLSYYYPIAVNFGIAFSEKDTCLKEIVNPKMKVFLKFAHPPDYLTLFV